MHQSVKCEIRLERAVPIFFKVSFVESKNKCIVVTASIVNWSVCEFALSTAFDQIRHYAAADLAVNLRLLRAMADIAVTTPRDDVRAALGDRARLLVERASENMLASDAAKLRERLAAAAQKAWPDFPPTTGVRPRQPDRRRRNGERWKCSLGRSC